jgi:2-keto-4-pentenoate hydratase
MGLGCVKTPKLKFQIESSSRFRQCEKQKLWQAPLEKTIEKTILKAVPLPGMSQAALRDCTEWVALGYEVVQSIFPDWKFAAPDAVAAHCVHGALVIGARHAIAPRKTDWQHELATFRVELYCNGKLSQRGSGALVLDSHF